jgi:hypothetical protein
LEDLERVLTVVREVVILKPLPLRAVSLFADTAYYPPFSFTTFVHSFEVCAAYSRVFPFNTEVCNMFVEVAIKSEGGSGGRRISTPPSLPIEPPTPTPNPQIPPNEPELPPSEPEFPPSKPELPPSKPKLPPIIPSPLPSPSPPSSPSQQPISVSWEVAVDGYEPEPFQVILIFSVKRFDETRGEYTHRVERFYDGVELPMLTLRIVSVQYDADSLSKTYHIIFGSLESPFYEEVFTLTVPPFNMQPMANPIIDHEQFVYEYS